MQPVLNFNISSKRIIGRTRYRQNLVQLNPIWLAVAETNPDVYKEMIHDTVVHELCHFVSKRVFGESGHGGNWKYCMFRIGMKPERIYTGTALPPWATAKKDLLEEVFKKFHVTDEVTDIDEEEEVE